MEPEKKTLLAPATSNGLTQFQSVGLNNWHTVFCLKQWERQLTHRPSSVRRDLKSLWCFCSHSQEKSAYITHWWAVRWMVCWWWFCIIWCFFVCVCVWKSQRNREREGANLASLIRGVAPLTCNYFCGSTSALTWRKRFSKGRLVPVELTDCCNSCICSVEADEGQAWNAWQTDVSLTPEWKCASMFISQKITRLDVQSTYGATLKV